MADAAREEERRKRREEREKKRLEEEAEYEAERKRRDAERSERRRKRFLGDDAPEESTSSRQNRSTSFAEESTRETSDSGSRDQRSATVTDRAAYEKSQQATKNPEVDEEEAERLRLEAEEKALLEEERRLQEEEEQLLNEEETTPVVDEELLERQQREEEERKEKEAEEERERTERARKRKQQEEEEERKEKEERARKRKQQDQEEEDRKERERKRKQREQEEEEERLERDRKRKQDDEDERARLAEEEEQRKLDEEERMLREEEERLAAEESKMQSIPEDETEEERMIREEEEKLREEERLLEEQERLHLETESTETDEKARELAALTAILSKDRENDKKKEQEAERKRKEEDQKRKSDAERKQREEEDKKRKDEQEKRKREDSEKQERERLNRIEQQRKIDGEKNEERRKQLQEEETQRRMLFEKRKEDEVKRAQEIEQRSQQQLAEYEIAKKQREEAERKRAEDDKQRALQKQQQAQKEYEERMKRFQQIKNESYKKLSAQELKQLEEKQINSFEQSKKEREQRAKANNLHHPEVSSYFSSLRTAVRTVDATLPVPEIVLIGATSSGKTALLESILETKLNSGVGNKRPVAFRLIHNPQAEQPIYKIQKDGEQRFSAITSLETELSKLQQNPSFEIINVQIEYKQFGFDLTFIDTPGIEVEDGEGTALESRLRTLCKNRTIVAVISASISLHTTQRQKVEKFVTSVDPRFARTFFAFSHLDLVLEQNLTHTDQLKKYFALEQKHNDKRTWFSNLSGDSRTETKNMNEALFQLYLSDCKRLIDMDVDNKLYNFVGISAVRHRLLHLAFETYKNVLPNVLVKLKHQKVGYETQILKMEKKMKDNMATLSLRNRANDLFLSTARILQQLFDGSLKLNVPVTGQSLEDEKTEAAFRWVLPLGRANQAIINTEDWSEACPNGHELLSGAQQFKRIINEFRKILQIVNLDEFNHDITKAAISGKSLNGQPNFIWAACEIAHRQIKQVFEPLVAGLSQRGAAFVHRHALAVTQHTSSQFPQFRSFLVDCFDNAIRTNAARFMNLMSEEFFTTATIYWNLADKSLKLNTAENVEQLAIKVFDEQKNRIAQKAMLYLVDCFIFTFFENNRGLENIQIELDGISETKLRDLFFASAKSDEISTELNSLHTNVKALISEEAKYADVRFPTLAY